MFCILNLIQSHLTKRNNYLDHVPPKFKPNYHDTNTDINTFETKTTREHDIPTDIATVQSILSPDGESERNEQLPQQHDGSEEDGCECGRGEAFETFKLKVELLCSQIGYGLPLEIEELPGGCEDRVISVKLASLEHPYYILRTPWRTSWPDEVTRELGDQISFLQHISQFDFLCAAPILAYDMTKDNALGFQYLLEQRLPGEALEVNYTHYLSMKGLKSQLVWLSS